MRSLIGAPRGNYLFYLATPPTFFGEIVQQLARLTWPRSTQKMVRLAPRHHENRLGMIWPRHAPEPDCVECVCEHQSYRIDHYLGKETVQNTAGVSFCHGMLEPTLNQRYIDHVQITVAETVGARAEAITTTPRGLMREYDAETTMFQLPRLVAMSRRTHLLPKRCVTRKRMVLHATRPLSYEEVLTHTIRGNTARAWPTGPPWSPIGRNLVYRRRRTRRRMRQ